MSEIEQHYSQFGTLPFMQVPPPPPSDSTSDPKSQSTLLIFKVMFHLNFVCMI